MFLLKEYSFKSIKIGLIGHSEGGEGIAIAAAKSSDVKFIVSLAGLATNGFASLIKQNEDLVNNSAMKPTDKKRSNSINKLMFETAFKYADSANVREKLEETF